MASGQNEIAWCPTMLRTLLLVIAMIPGPSLAQVQDRAPGLTKRTIFSTFNAHAPACRSPSSLRKALTYVQENERDFLQGLDHGLSLAAKDRGLEYNRVVVENDVAKAIEQLQLLKASKVGAVIGTSSDPIAISHKLQEVIWSGAFVGTVMPPPRNAASQCSAICDGEGADRRGDRLHKSQASRQGACGSAYSRYHAVLVAQVSGDARRPR